MVKAPWCSGLTYCPVKAEIAGSNPVGVATNQFWTRLNHYGLTPAFQPKLDTKLYPLSIYTIVKSLQDLAMEVINICPTHG